MVSFLVGVATFLNDDLGVSRVTKMEANRAGTVGNGGCDLCREGYWMVGECKGIRRDHHGGPYRG